VWLAIEFFATAAFSASFGFLCCSLMVAAKVSDISERLGRAEADLELQTSTIENLAKLLAKVVEESLSTGISSSTVKEAHIRLAQI
jgi:hypothetical protein